jgi:glycosyltransferase involved in cell wall biosynthesis
MGKILVLDFCNYEDYQIGGHLSMAKNLISAFGNDLTLVGITTDKNDPVGRWFVKNISGISFDYFALARYDKSKTKHLIPDRLVCYFLLNCYRKKILKAGIQNVFVQRHEIMLVLEKFRFRNVCYCFPGLESPLGISKYRYSKYIAEQFDKRFFRGLKKAQLVLASGDEKSIGEMVQRSHGIFTKDEVKMYPTRINTGVFRPLDRMDCRRKLSMPENKTIICTTGRLAWLKGWKFMIDSFILFLKNVSDSVFYIIGAGEDHQKIMDYLAEKDLSDKIFLPGGKKLEEISFYLNASDLFIMGSYKEGWSTALSEAIACGIPAVVTDFSSARDIIVEGRNGYVIGEHREDLFAEGMIKALKIPAPVYNANVLQYSTDRFKDDLLSIWKLI